MNSHVREWVARKLQKSARKAGQLARKPDVLASKVEKSARKEADRAQTGETHT
ncbi:hypothetical protein ACQKMN_06625 [Ureibacillus composti]